MKVIKTAVQLRRHISRITTTRKTIGFVPTMGALHDGHLSLIAAARRRCSIVVISIFVNPTQFGPGEDYRRYPRTLRRDAALCRRAGAHLLFVPAVKEIYPTGAAPSVTVGPLGECLEGASRPGHFNGVATVVLKLLSLVRPHRLFLGRKDYQQTLVIKELIRAFHLGVAVTVCPTVRESDGLAMSSRNRYLTPPQRRAAVLLHQALQVGLDRLRSGERSANALRAAMVRVLRQSPLIRLDYLAACNPATLAPLTRVDGRCLLAIAANIGRTRLIDNVMSSKNIA
ncbi:MAG: pantoate--beta-alanine ligase [Nitrospirota bacterium]